jgi:adenylate cyclase class 2
MLEIEMKFRVDDTADLRRRLNALGAKATGIRSDADTYFRPPHRDFAKTDEAFRLRQIGDENYLTYKGSKLDAITKTRREIEIPFAKGPDWAAKIRKMLECLSYSTVAVVHKRRETFEISRDGFELQVTIDDVQDVGLFAEIEIVANDATLNDARIAVQRLAGELGLTQSERRSYLEMLLAKTGTS